jgi:hypothetical protein
VETSNLDNSMAQIRYGRQEYEYAIANNDEEGKNGQGGSSLHPLMLLRNK